MQRAYSLEKIMILGKIEDRRRGQQRTRWLDNITNSMDMNLSEVQDTVKDRTAWHAAVLGVTKSWTGLSDLTTEKDIRMINGNFLFSKWLYSNGRGNLKIMHD